MSGWRCALAGSTALRFARLGEQLGLLRFEAALAALGFRQILAGLARLGHRQRRFRPSFLFDRAAAIEVGLRERVGLDRPFLALRVDQHHFERIARRLPARAVGKLEMHRQQRRMQGERQADRRAEHPFLRAEEEVELP